MSSNFTQIGSASTAKAAFTMVADAINFEHKDSVLAKWDVGEWGIDAHKGMLLTNQGCYYGNDVSNPSGFDWVNDQITVHGYITKVDEWWLAYVRNDEPEPKPEWTEWEDMLVFHNSDNVEYDFKWDVDDNYPSHPLTIITRRRKTND